MERVRINGPLSVALGSLVMKSMLLSAVAVLSIAGAAHASQFTGFSAGVDVGYNFADANQTRFSNPGGPFIFTQADAELSGWSYGLHGTYRHDTGAGFIVGGELALGFNDMRGDDKGAGGDKNEIAAKYDAALLGSAGFMISPTALLYAQVGWSYLSADSNVLNAPVESVSQSYMGPTAGAGLEFTVGAHSTMRLNYRYTDYMAERVAHPINLYDVETGPSVHSLSIGFNVKISE